MPRIKKDPKLISMELGLSEDQKRPKVNINGIRVM